MHSTVSTGPGDAGPSVNTTDIRVDRARSRACTTLIIEHKLKHTARRVRGSSCSLEIGRYCAIHKTQTHTRPASCDANSCKARELHGEMRWRQLLHQLDSRHHHRPAKQLRALEWRCLRFPPPGACHAFRLRHKRRATSSVFGLGLASSPAVAAGFAAWAMQFSTSNAEDSHSRLRRSAGRWSPVAVEHAAGDGGAGGGHEVRGH